MNAEHPPESPRNTPPSRPFPLWLISLPLIALLLLLTLRRPLPDNPPPAPTTPPTAKAAPTANVSPTATPRAAAPRPVRLMLFVPDEDGRLQRKTVASALPPVSAADLADPKKRVALQSEAVTDALERLMKSAPSDFPSGAKLRGPIRYQNGVARLDFNSNFTDPNFWQGSIRILASTQAIAHTVAATAQALGGQKDGAVQFLVEGKPIEVLGELAVDEPLTPDAKMVSGG